jgi:hypothetical protein
MQTLWLILIVLSTVVLGGCEVIGGIFKAGMWTGVIVVVLVVLVIAFVASKFRR